MSLATFQTIIDKVPSRVRIDFSGMAEPWANPNATKMLEMALQQKGRHVRVYTTLYGISVEDSLFITQTLLPRHADQIDVICLHLPDDNMNMRGYKDSREYRQVLKNFLAMAENVPQLGQKFQKMTMDKTGKLHKSLQDLLPAFGDWSGHSRAGSLSEEQQEKSGAKPPAHNDFSLACAITPFYDHNVVLPNGDFVLCCMDFSLKHVLGNLLRSDYWDLFLSQELSRIRVENQKTEFSKRSICKECENVIKFKADQNEMWVYDLPHALPQEIGLRDVLCYIRRKIVSVFRR
jgi:hypothetical protein